MGEVDFSPESVVTIASQEHSGISNKLTFLQRKILGKREGNINAIVVNSPAEQVPAVERHPSSGAIIIEGVPIWSGKENRLSNEAVDALKRQENIEGGVGGAYKAVYFSKDKSEVLLVCRKGDEKELKSVRTQVEFYEQHKARMKGVIVPMIKKIEGVQKGERIILGMVQEKYGVSFDEFIARGGTISEAEVMRFAQAYAQFIEQTGVVHGDVVFMKRDRNKELIGHEFNADNLRVGVDGQLRFIDYNGLADRAFHDPESPYQEERVIDRLNPDGVPNKKYVDIAKQQPRLLEIALRRHLGYQVPDQLLFPSL